MFRGAIFLTLSALHVQRHSGMFLLPEELSFSHFDKEEEVRLLTYTEHMTALQKHLLENYDIHRRPVKDLAEPVNVMITLTMEHVSVDEKEQSMTIYGYITLNWVDEFLQWKADDYSGVSTITLHENDIWTPHLNVANSIAGVGKHFHFGADCKVSVSDDGDVYLKQRVNFKIGCEFDFAGFPKDAQSCALKLVPFERMDEVALRAITTIGLSPMVAGLDDRTKSFQQKSIVGDFNIYRIDSMIDYFNTAGSCYYPVTTEEMESTWSTFTYEVFIKRIAATHGYIFMLPLFILTLLPILSCLLPSVLHAIFLNVATVTAHLIFIHDFISRVPIGVKSTPRIVIFYCFSLAFTSFLALVHLVVYLFISWETSPIILYNTIISFASRLVPPVEKLKVKALTFEEWQARGRNVLLPVFVGIILITELSLAIRF